MDNLHFQEHLKVKPVAFSLKRLVILFNSQFIRFFNPSTKWICTMNCTSIQKQPSEMFCKKEVLENFTKFIGKHLRQSLFFNKVASVRLTTLLEKRLCTALVSCEFCEHFKNTFFQRTPLMAASKYCVNF